MKLRLTLLALAIAFGAAAQTPASEPRKIQVLIITGQDAHPWKESTPYLKSLLEKTGRFEVRVTEEFRGATIDSLSPYDVAIMNYSDEKLQTQTWSDTTKEALLRFVKSGEGVVFYHHSAASLQNWPEYQKLVGCVWRSNDSHHAPVHDYQVDIRDPEHPITRGMAAFMAKTDELYAGLYCLPAGSFHVLATGFDDHAMYATNKKNAKIPRGPSQDEPLLWTLSYGAGRVFATMPGNDMRAVYTPGFVATITRGPEWAATGDVTIPLPPELRK